MKSVYTFPSMVERLPHGMLPADVAVGSYIMGQPTGETPFHDRATEWARNYVADRARINDIKKEQFRIGGWRNMLPKPEPQGSFIRPLSLSGSIRYGVSEPLSGGGGSFRTAQGSQYGIDALRRRGEQLSQMAQDESLGIPIPPSAQGQPAGLTGYSEDVESVLTSINLTLAEIQNIFDVSAPPLDSSQFKDLNESLRKIFANLVKYGVYFKLDDLNPIRDTFDSIQQSARTIAGSTDSTPALGALPIEDEITVVILGATRPLSVRLQSALQKFASMIDKLKALSEALIASFGRDEKARITAIRVFARDLAKVSPTSPITAMDIAIYMSREARRTARATMLPEARARQARDEALVPTAPAPASARAPPASARPPPREARPAPPAEPAEAPPARPSARPPAPASSGALAEQVAERARQRRERLGIEGEGKKRSRTPSKRNAMIAKLMKSKKMTLPEASRYIKQHNLA